MFQIGNLVFHLKMIKREEKTESKAEELNNKYNKF